MPQILDISSRYATNKYTEQQKSSIQLCINTVKNAVFHNTPGEPHVHGY